MTPMSFAVDLLLRRARLCGDRVALIGAGDGEATSYAAWHRRVNGVAWALWAREGVRPGDRVALLAENSPEWLDLWLACGRIGAVLQALSHRQPPSGLAPMVEAADPRVVVASAAHFVLANDAAGGRLVRPLEELALPPADDGPPAPCPRLDDPWVLCATGGTTGRPKQAVLTHGNIRWNAAGTAASWELHPRAVGLLNAPLFHTGGMNVLTAPLLWAGGASVVCSGFDAGQALDLIDRGAVSHVFGVPTMLSMIAAHPRFAHTNLTGLELLISGGAPCPPSLVDVYADRGIQLRQGYGLTEAGPNTFWLPEPELDRKPGFVGYPLLHVETRVVAPSGREALPGEVGELHLRGPHVTPGYYGDEEATNAAFVDDWLATGDLVVRDEDGAFRVVGRKKDMFISGGENVYPAEVEAALLRVAGVLEACVFGRPDPKWGEVGHAFVVAPGLDAAAIAAGLDGLLPRFARPARYHLLDALPKTAAGKVDRSSLLGADDP